MWGLCRPWRLQQEAMRATMSVGSSNEVSAGPGGGARGREVVWSCLIGTSRAQDWAEDAGCGVCVCEGLGVDNVDSMCRPRPCHGRERDPAPPARRLLLLRLCIPSGFLVVFEKPTRSSCTCTFTCSKDTAPAMADTSPSSFPKFSAENLSGADQKGGVTVRAVDGGGRGTRDSVAWWPMLMRAMPWASHRPCDHHCMLTIRGVHVRVCCARECVFPHQGERSRSGPRERRSRVDG